MCRVAVASSLGLEMRPSFPGYEERDHLLHSLGREGCYLTEFELSQLEISITISEMAQLSRGWKRKVRVPWPKLPLLEGMEGR